MNISPVGLRRFAFLTFLAVGFAIAVYPEPPVKSLTPADGWQATGHADRITLPQFPNQFRQLRQSAVADRTAIAYRSWSPEAGVQPIEVVSPPFKATPAISVVVTGTTRTPKGGSRAFLTCSAHPQQVDVFLGSVNVNAAEAIIRLSPRWCPGDTRLHLINGDKDTYVGVGSVFEISALSVWKSSFVGLLPYLALALLIPGAIALVGAALAARFAPALPALPSALGSIGIAALVVFFGYAFVPARASAFLPIAALLALVAGKWVAGRDSVASAARELAPSAGAWAVAAVAYFALLCAADNGVGHWAPNSRFWPASWSSDNEMPWLFAEAVRNGWNLAGLFGGGWKPTDRPPLMTGAHLLVADVFRWLQWGNDGTYLRGLAFNAAAIAFSALWVPAAVFLLEAMLGLRRGRARAVVIMVGLLPFAIFNTVYGWPKALGAAFGLVAAVMAVLASRPERASSRRLCVMAFGVLGALSILAHASGALFLLPVSIWLGIVTLKKDPRALLQGAALGAALLLAWPLYQRGVLPSHDPLTKFALTGDFGFGNPSKGLLTMMAERYAALTLPQWLDIKWRMLLQPLLPIDTAVYPMQVNADFGADFLGSLRAWDVLVLSGGNVLILVAAAVVVGASALRRRAGTNAPIEPIDAAASSCVWLALVVWMLLVVLFLASLQLHHWPSAAILALACGAFGWTSVRRPALFRALAVAAILYAGLVWIFGPLREARAVDVVAMSSFALIGTWLVLGNLLHFDQEERGGAEAATEARSRPAGGPPASLPRLEGRALVWGRATAYAPDVHEESTPAVARALRWGAVAAGLGYLLFLMLTINNPLIDDHSFRQTQTAISVFHMLAGGPWLAYFTPILGAPWSIPFEAPVYHWSVAALASVLPLEASGRLVSAAYFAGALFFGYRFLKRLFPADSGVPVVFLLLMLASPLYLFWGRAFLIETCAVFFGMAYLFFGYRYYELGAKRDLAWAASAAVLVALAKTTTWPAFVLTLGVFILIRAARERCLRFARTGWLIATVAVALVAALGWTAFADSLKVLNTLGATLTSSLMQDMIYGWASQRLGPELWHWALLRRMLPDILGLFWYLPALALAALMPFARFRRSLLAPVLAQLGAFLFPMLVFTNVHIVHSYYQVANGIFLIMAAAIVVGSMMGGRRWLAGVPILALLVAGQVAYFASHQWKSGFAPFPEEPIVSAARFAKEHTRPDQAVLAVGVEWSSIVHLYSERKGLALATWFPADRAGKVLGDLSGSFAGMQLGAIVDCRATTSASYSPLHLERIEKLLSEFRARPGVLERKFDGCTTIAVGK